MGKNLEMLVVAASVGAGMGLAQTNGGSDGLTVPNVIKYGLTAAVIGTATAVGITTVKLGIDYLTGRSRNQYRGK